MFSAVLEAGRSFSALLSLSALDSLWEEAVSSLLDSALDSLLDSDALDAELEECSELPEALSAVLWEELDEDAGFSSELPELLDVLPELAPEEDELEEPEEELADDGELVAVIAAAIAAYEGSTSTDGFVVRSIKRSKTNKWKRA